MWDKVLTTLVIWVSTAVMSYTVKNPYVFSFIVFVTLVVSVNIWISQKGGK